MEQTSRERRLSCLSSHLPIDICREQKLPCSSRRDSAQWPNTHASISHMFLHPSKEIHSYWQERHEPDAKRTKPGQLARPGLESTTRIFKPPKPARRRLRLGLGLLQVLGQLPIYCTWLNCGRRGSREAKENLRSNSYGRYQKEREGGRDCSKACQRLQKIKNTYGYRYSLWLSLALFCHSCTTNITPTPSRFLSSQVLTSPWPRWKSPPPVDTRPSVSGSLQRSTLVVSCVSAPSTSLHGGRPTTGKAANGVGGGDGHAGFRCPGSSASSGQDTLRPRGCSADGTLELLECPSASSASSA